MKDMQDKELLKVDFNEEDAILQFDGIPRLLSSHKAGWKNIVLEHIVESPASESPEFQTAQHMLVIHLCSLTGSERKLDGHYQQENPMPGEIAIAPANIPHWTRDFQQAEAIILGLEPQLISHVAHESINPDQVEIIPQFAQPDPLIYGIGRSLRAELESQGVGSHIYVESLCNTLAVHLLRRYASRQHCIREYSDGLPKYKLRQAIDYIDANLDQEIRLANIAEVVGMSQYYFCQLFKQSMGIAPYQYVIQQRVERAKQLLQQREITISDIALQCGFANQSHFTKHFRKLTGITPKACRER